LIAREERNRAVYEQFAYDSRDRLDYARRSGSVVLDLSYDEVGNVTSKSDIGNYRYDPTRKHAVVAAGSNAYSYDANGAVVNANGTTISWLSYDLPSQLTHPRATTQPSTTAGPRALPAGGPCGWQPDRDVVWGRRPLRKNHA